MTDILRVIPPVVDKNTMQTDEALRDPSVPFDMQGVRYTTENPEDSGPLGHHNMLKREAGVATLVNLLKGPTVTVNYLKNTYMLEEVVSLLSMDSNTMIQGIHQLLDALLISPKHIVDELTDQECVSTLLRGELSDFLRGVLSGKPELRVETVELLKVVSGNISRQGVLNSVANSLKYLSE